MAVYAEVSLRLSPRAPVYGHNRSVTTGSFRACHSCIAAPVDFKAANNLC